MNSGGYTMTITNGWSAEEIATLTEKWGVISAPEIAPLVHKTTSAVIGKANRLGLPAVPRERAAEWAQMSNRERLARQVA